ncbi:MAG: DNA repair protein RecO [Porphyromonadaceae bacterium CG2_30_38_12]|nr:MAG: DNA repair protein RecO [Porphyromonadaceae bacterium CG2_30_38_12]
MLSKTKGIVLHSIKYSESSRIITIYTELFGRISYLVRGINKRKSPTKVAFFQPLSLVEMEVVHVPTKDIQTIKEIRIDIAFGGIPYDPVKNALALFIAEFLYRIIRLTVPDSRMFQYISNALQFLDCSSESLANFHLVFMIGLSRFLGFEPNNSDQAAKFFDLLNGIFEHNKPLHTHYLRDEKVDLFSRLIETDFFNMHQVKLSREQRNEQLDSLIEYYRLHVNGFQGLNSTAVLQNLFD